VPRVLAAFGAVAAACLLYAASLARQLSSSWINEGDAYIGVKAGDWVLRRIPVPPTWNYTHGMGEAWLTVPFIAVFGESVPAVHLRNGAFGVLGIVACALLAFELGAGLFGAAAAAVLLVLDPAWIFNAEGGIACAIASSALAPLSLALWLRAARTGRPWLSAASALTLGVALWTRSTMLGWILGLAAAAAVGALPRPWPGLPTRRRRALIAACVALVLLPQLPFLIAVLDARSFFEFVQRSHGHFHAVPGPAAAFKVCLVQLAILIDAPLDGRGLPLLLPCGTLAALALSSRRPTRRDALPWALLACYFLLSMLSPTHLEGCHLVPLVPLFWAAVCALAAKPDRPVLRRLAGAALLALLCWRGRAFARYMRADRSSDDAAARALCSFFAVRPGARPVLLEGNSRDSDPYFSVVLGSHGTIVPLVIRDGSDAIWDDAFSDPDARFVLREGGNPFYEARFRSELAKRRLAADLESAIRARDSAPSGDIYRLGWWSMKSFNILGSQPPPPSYDVYRVRRPFAGRASRMGSFSFVRRGGMLPKGGGR
jgi:hypothetical protein